MLPTCYMLVFDPVDKTSCIPPGSVSGPLCFTLFINDLLAEVKHCIIKLYTDDVKLIIISFQ